MVKSLHARHHQLADHQRQIEILENGIGHAEQFTSLKKKIEAIGQYPLRPQRSRYSRLT